MKIAVAGATGRVGRHVVDVLTEQGHEAVAMSRSTGVDVITATGLDAALAGVDVVIDAATGPSPEQQAATEFFVTAARNLHQAGSRAGVGRIVTVSIIGTDRFKGGYGRAKAAHEKVMRDEPVPVRIVRAAQFHEFVGQLLEWSTRDGVATVPLMRTQLVAARTVAETVVEVATGPDRTGDEFATRPERTADEIATGPDRTAGEIVEIAGPREERLVEMARLLAAKRGAPRHVVEQRNPDDPDDELNASGGLLPSPGARLAGPTFAQWLAELPDPES
jgi:uncharacterized protein YbjT (DUF2867 family)